MNKKKRAGSLSGTMITRRQRRDGVGFVISEGAPGPQEFSEDIPHQTSEQELSASAPGVKADEDVMADGAAVERRTDAEFLEATPPEEATLVVPRGNGPPVAAEVVPLYPHRLGAPGDPEAAEGPGGDAAPQAELLVQALRAADIAEAEELFSAMTGLGHVAVLRLLYGPDGNDLAMACRALGMEQLQFVSIYILSRKLGLGEEVLDPRELTRIVAFFEGTDETEAVAWLAACCVSDQNGGENSPQPPQS